MPSVQNGLLQNVAVKRLYDILMDTDAEVTMTLRLLTALGTTSETDGGTEATPGSGGYARVTTVAADWADAQQPPLSLTNPGIANARTFSFGPGTGAGVAYTHVALFHGDTCMAIWAPDAQGLSLNEVAVFGPGSLRINIGDAPYTFTPV